MLVVGAGYPGLLSGWRARLVTALSSVPDSSDVIKFEVIRDSVVKFMEEAAGVEAESTTGS